MSFWPAPTYPTARKEHRCNMCGRIINQGELYMRGAGMDDGTAWTWKECIHCQLLRKQFPDSVDSGLTDGYTGEDVREWEPDTFQGWLVQARFLHQWQHGNGEMVQVVGSVPVLMTGGAA